MFLVQILVSVDEVVVRSSKYLKVIRTVAGMTMVMSAAEVLVARGITWDESVAAVAEGSGRDGRDEHWGVHDIGGLKSRGRGAFMWAFGVEAAIHSRGCGGDAC